MRFAIQRLLVASFSVAVGFSYPAPQKNTPKCLPVKRIFDYITLYKQSPNTFPPAEITGMVRDFGLCTPPTSDEVKKMAASGAPAELLDAIKKAAGGPENLNERESGIGVEKVIVVPKKGRLKVSCQPVN